MKIALIIGAAIFFNTVAYSQTKPSPGGVRNPFIWFKADTIGKSPVFRSLLKQPDSIMNLPAKTTVKQLNFNPAVALNGSKEVVIPLKDSSLALSTFFTVYQSAETQQEGIIWHLRKLNITTLAATTNRFADLESLNYMNFKDLQPELVKVGIYSQQKMRDTVFPLNQSFRLGSKPSDRNLPVQNFNGSIPEFIIYNRTLTSAERLQVASYLSLKYGVTLADPMGTYLNSSGDVLWDGQIYFKHHQNVAGIGRDDDSGLLQPKSISSSAPGLLTISAKGDMGNKQYLIWGDNGLPLTPDEKQPGIPQLLQRKWVVSSTTSGQSLVTGIDIDTRQFDVRLPVTPVYWLAIDRSALGTFSSKQTDLFRMNSLDKSGIAHFGDVQFGRAGSSYENMGIVVSATNLLATITVTDAKCNQESGGSIEIKITGEKHPFQLVVTPVNGKPLYDKPVQGIESEQIHNLPAGQYQFTVTDADLASYSDSFFINDEGAAKPLSVKNNYQLTKSESLTIRADSLMPATTIYQWTDPNGFTFSGATITISQPGNYVLTCNTNGCTYRQTVQITRQDEGIFKDVVVYPNPSTGSFSAKVTLEQQAPVIMEIYSGDGKKLTSAQSSGRANYELGEHVQNSGTYIIRFISGKYVTSRKLIVVN